MIGGSDAQWACQRARGQLLRRVPTVAVPERWKTPLVMIDNDRRKGRWCRLERTSAGGRCVGRENTRGDLGCAQRKRSTHTGDDIVRCRWLGRARSDRYDFAIGYAHGVHGRHLSRRGGSDYLHGSCVRDPDGRTSTDPDVKGWLGKDGRRGALFDVAVSAGADRTGWSLQTRWAHVTCDAPTVLRR